MNYYLCLDVGGTNIKCGVINSNGELVSDKLFTYKAYSGEDKDTIIANFIKILKDLTKTIDDGSSRIEAIGMAFPGPFDYENGISLIRGIGKYDRLYGINLKKELLKRIACDKDLSLIIDKTDPIAFFHDVKAFATGEMFYGKGKKFERCIYLCIGTGAGTAFSVNKKLVDGKHGVPANGWIFDTEFRDGIIDDYISVRGLHNIASKILCENADGRELYLRAVNNDKAALLVFEQFGEILYEAISPFISKFKADCIILGGGISNSFEFFGRQIVEFCKAEKVEIVLTDNTSKSTLKGIYKQLRQGEGQHV